MTATDLAAALVRRWTRGYTRGLPMAIAARRREELDADLADHIADARMHGTPDARLALGLAGRMARGIPADLTWRADQARRIDARASGGPMIGQTAHRLGIAVAVFSILFLAWGVAAMGIVGAEGDRFDLLYLALAGGAIVAAGLVRFRPAGMVRVLLGMAVAQVAITIVAIALGKQDDPATSWAELLGLNAMFIALYLGAAWLLTRAARGAPAEAA